MSEDYQGADQDVEWLHGTMATATAHVGAVRVDPARLRRAQRRRRLSQGGVAAGVLSVALAATTVGMHGGGGRAGTPALTGPTRTSQAPTTARSPAAVSITPIDVTVYDSDDGSEGKATVAGVLTGTGAWTTSQYCQRYATFDGIAKSTGLLFDLGRPTSLAGTTVTVGIPGANLELWISDSSVQTMPSVRPGQPPAEFTKIADADSVATKTVLAPPKAVTTRYVLVWFSGSLPAVPNPNSSIRCAHDDGNRYGDSITSVQFARG